MDKKGVIPIFVFIAGIALIFILLGIFLFSSKFRFILIGIGVIIAGIYILGSVRNDKIKIISFLILLIVGMALIFGAGVLQQQLGGEYVNVPTFGYYKCEPSGSSIRLYESNKEIPIGGKTIRCPSNTERCTVTLTTPDKTGFTDRGFEYYVCPEGKLFTDSCSTGSSSGGARVKTSEMKTITGVFGFYGLSIPIGSESTQATKEITISPDEELWVQYQRKGILGSWKEASGASYNILYVPFVIFKYDTFSSLNGQPYTQAKDGCVFKGNEGYNFILKATFDLGDKNRNTRVNSLEPYETRTYASKFIPIAKENYGFVTYKNQDAYCIDGKIYAIQEVTTINGIYNVVGSAVNDQIGLELCCPGDTEPGRTCTNEFRWKDLAQTKEEAQEQIEKGEGVSCNAFKPCPNSEWQPYSNTQLWRNICQNSFCIPEYLDVGCTTNDECSEGQVCDKKVWKCQIPPGEQEQEEVKEEKLACKWYQEERTPKELKFRWYNYIGIGDPDVIEGEPICVTAGLVYGIIAGVVILILGIIAILVFRMPRRRR